MYYTAQELVERLNEEEGMKMTVRKIRYYSQIDMLSPTESVNGKKKYTNKHLEELRAIQSMQKIGAKLEDIKENIRDLDVGSLTDISEKSSYLNSTRIFETEIEIVDNDVSITFNKNTLPEKKSEMIEAMRRISKRFQGK